MPNSAQQVGQAELVSSELAAYGSCPRFEVCRDCGWGGGISDGIHPPVNGGHPLGNKGFSPDAAPPVVKASHSGWRCSLSQVIKALLFLLGLSLCGADLCTQTQQTLTNTVASAPHHQRRIKSSLYAPAKSEARVQRHRTFLTLPPTTPALARGP